MAFNTHRVFLVFCLVPVCWAQSAAAQHRLQPQPQPAPFASQGHFRPISDSQGMVAGNATGEYRQMPAGYVQLNSAMYPSPQQNIPAQMGSTLITNQAFAPHEMLYAHSYHAIYPPYYYKVKGSWIWTPFGIRSHDTWKLRGTEVKVNYKSSFGMFNKFRPPCVR